MTINERIGLILKEKNLTANEFAAKLEVRSSNISHIITGRNKPSFDFLEKLISVFPEIDTLWLIKGEGDMWVQVGAEDDITEEVSVISAPEVVIRGLNRETNVSMQTNLFGETESLERSITKPKKPISIVLPKSSHIEVDEKQSPKIDNEKKISSIIVYYSNGSFEEFVSKV